MPPPSSQDNFRIPAEKALPDHSLIVTLIAHKSPSTRNPVSMIINHFVFSAVRQKIGQTLDVEGFA